MIPRIPTWITVILGSLLLSGCGGGGNRAPANLPPNPAFVSTPGQGTLPLLVQFDASASRDFDGSIRSYAWGFDEPAGGSRTSTVTTTHTYNAAGVYTVTLRVTDDDGASATTARSITVSPVLATLSGRIQILSSSAVDADVNDIGSPPTSNNDFSTAQALPNPVTLGGFANLPLTGVGLAPDRGNLFNTGDPGDFYSVSMAGNEVIILDIADPATAEQALYLYDASQNLVDVDDGPNATQSVQAPAAGTYFIEVRPVAGASNYVMSVGQDLLPTRTGLPGLNDPFKTDELLLTTSVAGLGGEYGLTEVARSGNITLMRTAGAQATMSRLGRHAPFDRRWSAEKREKYATRAMIETLRRDRRVQIAEPNYLRYAHAVPNDTFYGLQWHYPAINLPLAWDITTGDNSVIVAVVDTGVLLTHPDLNDQLVPGFDFIEDPDRALDGDGRDSDPTDEGDLAFGGSSSFHGTHVAGTIAAETNTDPNNPSPGVAGIAWNTRIMPLRVLGFDGGTSFDVIEAVKWAAGLSNVSGTLPAQRADVINLSLGGGAPSQSEQMALDEVRAAGVIVIASAGNDASALPSYPAAYNNVVSVSATTIQNNAIAPYSNRGPTIDIAAPGGSNVTDINGDGIGDGVISTLGDDSDPLNVQFGYSALQGTSMAAPHVAGVVALMKAVHPNLTPQEFDIALLAGELTDDLGTPGRDDQYGHGLINAHKAVLAALALAAGQGANPGPILSLSASTLVFGSALDQQALTLSNVGTGTVTVLAQDIIPAEPWLTVAPDTVDATGMGTYLVTVDRSGLAEGSYNATIDITSDAPNPNVTISLTMRVFSGSPSADAGLHYVIVVDDNGDTLANLIDTVGVSGGEYAYTLSAVPPGDYRIFAGTDSDDDSFLCDAGEACGTYGTLDSPDFITVDGVDHMDLDFTSEFRVNYSALGTSGARGALGNTVNGIDAAGGGKPVPIRKQEPRTFQ